MRPFRWPALSELDPVIIGSWKIVRPRLAVFVLVAVLAGLGWGWRIGATWALSMALSEALMTFAAEPLWQGRPAEPRHRLAYAAGAVLGVFTLLSLSVLFWTSDGSGGRFIALAVWAVLLVNAISFAFRSLLAMMIFFLPVALVMIGTTLALPRFEGAQQVMAVAGVSVFALYAGLSAYRDAMAARALTQANEDLERARQAAESANAAKSAFLAMMSHEIRTPLNGVLGMAQVMQAKALARGQRERLGVIQKSGERLLGMLNNLLDMSRIEAGGLVLEDGETDFQALAEDAAETFYALADSKGLSLHVSVAASARGRWRADPTRLRQVLHNLVSNAVKFTDSGSVALRIAAADGPVVIEVADTGPGVPPDRQAVIFDAFVQADPSVTRRFGGSGLGLAICRQLAQMMGGDIALDSPPGEGATFTVRLPLERLGRKAALAA